MEIYKQPKSKNWYYDFYTADGRRVRKSTGTDDPVKAQEVADKSKAAAWDVKPQLRGATWSSAVNKWLDVETRSSSELYALAKFSKFYKDRPLDAVTPESIEAALTSFTKTAGTFTRYRTMVAAILTLSGAKLKLPVRKDKKKKTRKWITHEQWTKLRAELPAHIRPAADFAIATGLRQANVLGLRWDHCDLRRRLVWIDAADAKGDENLPIPLSDAAVKALESVKGQHKDWCFTYRGKPFKDIKTSFIAACIRAELGGYVDKKYQGFTWHGFRHTWATWHIQSGTPLEVLQKLGGWSDLRMVQNYAHHTAGHIAAYANNAESGMTKKYD